MVFLLPIRISNRALFDTSIRNFQSNFSRAPTVHGVYFSGSISMATYILTLLVFFPRNVRNVELRKRNDTHSLSFVANDLNNWRKILGLHAICTIATKIGKYVEAVTLIPIIHKYETERVDVKFLIILTFFSLNTKSTHRIIEN